MLFNKDKLLAGSSVGMVPSLQEIIGWTYGAHLTGLSFRIRQGVWSSLIKVDFVNTAKVAYLDVGIFGRCVERTCEVAESGWIEWRDDDYPPKERRLTRPAK